MIKECEIIGENYDSKLKCTPIESMASGLFYIGKYHNKKFYTEAEEYDCRDTLLEEHLSENTRSNVVDLKHLSIVAENPHLLIKAIKVLEKKLKLKVKSLLYLGKMKSCNYWDYDEYVDDYNYDNDYNDVEIPKPKITIIKKQVVIKPSAWWRNNPTRFSFLTAFIKAIALDGNSDFNKKFGRNNLDAILNLRYFKNTKRATKLFLDGHTKISQPYSIYGRDAYSYGWVERFGNCRNEKLNDLRK